MGRRIRRQPLMASYGPVPTRDDWQTRQTRYERGITFGLWRRRAALVICCGSIVLCAAILATIIIAFGG